MSSGHLIVIGGGAAGFFCAVNAAALNPSLRVTVLEKTGKLLSKVRISGGGRCNVTHNGTSISEMIRNYPRGKNFVKQTFRHFFIQDTVQWFEKRNVKLKAEEDGRMFPVSDSSESIIHCLLQEADKRKVDVRTGMNVQAIEITGDAASGRFRVHAAGGRSFDADYVCVACGGFSKTSQYEWIHELGHTIVPAVPSLFTFNIKDNPVGELMGISVNDAGVKIKGTSYIRKGPVLITHWGFSGPAILKLSAYAALWLAEVDYDFMITVNWLGNMNENNVLEQLKIFRFEMARRKIHNKNPFGLPARLWDYLLTESGINAGLNWADLPARQQNILAKNLCTQEFKIKGKTTFKEEFVTAGGVSLSEVSPVTMQSKIVPDLYFAGEILDVDGITGGFNFQHAWTSGFVAASAIAAKSGSVA